MVDFPNGERGTERVRVLFVFFGASILRLKASAVSF
jgi:hypothetical protein